MHTPPKLGLGVALAAALLGVLAACSDDSQPSTKGAAGHAGEGGSTAGSKASAGSSGKSTAAGEASGGTSTGPGGSSGGGTPTSVQTFWGNFAEALCHRYWYCPQDEDLYEDRGRLRAVAQDEARCVPMVEELILARPRIQALNRGVTSGDLQLQAAQVAGCLAVAASCDYPSDLDPEPGTIRLEDVVACREVFEGSVATGADCDLSEQCEGGAICKAQAGGKCAGVCTALLAKGETCAVDRECIAADGAWPICTTGKKCSQTPIGKPGAVGQSCNVASNYPLCADDLWCPTTGCQPAVALGDECDSGTIAISQCQDGHCQDGVCVAYGVSTQAGDDCDDAGLRGLGEQLCDSFASLVCVAEKCVETDRSEGSPCNDAYWFDAALCPPKALLADGATCTNADQCEGGLCRGTCASQLCAN